MDKQGEIGPPMQTRAQKRREAQADKPEDGNKSVQSSSEFHGFDEEIIEQAERNKEGLSEEERPEPRIEYRLIEKSTSSDKDKLLEKTLQMLADTQAELQSLRLRNHSSDRTRTKKPFDTSSLKNIDEDTGWTGFREWITAWEINAKHYNLEEYSPDQQSNALMKALGPRAIRIMEDDLKKDWQSRSIEQIIQDLKEHFNKQRNLRAERRKFAKRMQRSDESMANYALELFKMADAAGYQNGMSKEEIIANQIIEGAYLSLIHI